MNCIILSGRLTKDPEVKYTQSGKVVASFALAVNRPFAKEGEPKADFFNCQVWGKQAEALGNYIHKGDPLLVEGRLQIRQYTDKNNSQRWITEIVCDKTEFLPKGNKVAASRETQPPAGGFDGMGQAFEEEIPF